MAYFYGYNRRARARRNRWIGGGNAIDYKDFIGISIVFWGFIVFLVILGAFVEAKKEPKGDEIFCVSKVTKKQVEIVNVQDSNRLTFYSIKFDEPIVGELVMYNTDERKFYEVQIGEVIECIKERG